MEIDKKKYEQYVKEITPVHSLGASMAKAFLVGGLICLLGQAMMNCMTGPLEMDKEAASTWTSPFSGRGRTSLTASWGTLTPTPGPSWRG